MYYSEWCGFCHRARALLDAKGVPWTGIDVDMTQGARQEMRERGGGHTVPQIFIDGAPIGGCQEIYALEAEGRLDALLGVASADLDGGRTDAGKDGGGGD